MGLVTVRDEWTKLIGHRFLNSQICLWIGILQALICIWGVAQHCHSFIHYQKILRCDFLEGALPLEAADAVIFDIGLFHSLWGIRGCIAEYLDGGFGRLVWCVTHIISLTASLPFAFVSRPRPCFLWPLLIQWFLNKQLFGHVHGSRFPHRLTKTKANGRERKNQQSAYGIGLLILLIAALPRILPQLMEPHVVPIVPIFFYISGTMLNFFLLYVYWHWYWHVASLWGSAVKVRFGEMVRNANNRSRRDRPRIPKQESGSLQPLDADRLARQTAIPSETALTTVRHSLTWDDVNVSQVFKEFEKKMNGKLVNGTLKNGNGESPPHAPFGLLEVPPMSKIVRARYPQKPLVIRASAKREKDETAIKHNGATKRALYRQKRASREMSTEREPFKKQTRRRDIPVEPPGVEVVANSLREDQESKRFLQNGVMLSKDTLVRRQSTVTIIPDPLVIPPITGLEENLTTSPPPPPIYATRVSENAYENRMLRQQDEEKFSFKPKQQEWIPRRRLPRTPCGTPAGEIRRPKFYLPSTEL